MVSLWTKLFKSDIVHTCCWLFKLCITVKNNSILSFMALPSHRLPMNNYHKSPPSSTLIKNRILWMSWLLFPFVLFPCSYVKICWMANTQFVCQHIYANIKMDNLFCHYICANPKTDNLLTSTYVFMCSTCVISNNLLSRKTKDTLHLGTE